MNLSPHSFTNSEASAPLHHLLLSFGKERLRQEQTSHATQTLSAETLSIMELLQHESAESLEKRVRELTVKQLSATLRMQMPQMEEVALLNTLENLVLVGEIGYQEFIQRVQRLFPREMDALEQSMRMKAAALAL